MPDIKTALSTALSEWEQDDKQQEKQMQQQPYFSVTNNVTRATFDYVKNNPASASGEVSRALAQRGYKPSSIGSLLTQFVKKGLCTRDEQNRYSVAVPEYVPMKASKHVKQVIQKAKATRGEGIAALSAQPTQRLVWDVETVLNSMSIVQARAMYDALKKIFGG
jgi:predicted transcriptional regulator